jgi:hypothetical protein
VQISGTTSIIGDVEAERTTTTVFAPISSGIECGGMAVAEMQVLGNAAFARARHYNGLQIKLLVTIITICESRREL